MNTMEYIHNMKTKDFLEKAIEFAKNLGMVDNGEATKKKKNVVIRKNISSDVGNVPYFGFIRPEEQLSGPYSDFSLVFFPATIDSNLYVMSLGVGSEGFRNDYQLASQPGTRRMFLKILPQESRYSAFCKPDFTDIETAIAFGDTIVDSEVNLEKYKSVLSIGCLINIEEEKDLDYVYAWIAQYAELRGWASTRLQRNNAEQAISKCRQQGKNQEQQERDVVDLLESRKFVILQGAPGTGKTYLAEKIGKEEYNTIFLTQFHAETSYSDLVEGIMPKLGITNSVVYERKEVILVEAIKYAIDNPNEKVLLIIDEINRANLSNVLGPVFYLFEPKRQSIPGQGLRLETMGDTILNKVPDNLHVVATMNTADRSIAVVDFALRRRFAWYTIEPRFFGEGEGKELFDKVSRLFEKHASDSELNLQPGGSYFIADNREELNAKIEYELMPLMKEYFDEGLLSGAKTDFSDLFYQEIHKPLYK